MMEGTGVAVDTVVVVVVVVVASAVRTAPLLSVIIDKDD